MPAIPQPNLASLFDAGLFNRRLGEILVSLFTEIAVITGIGIVLVVFLFFLEWRLSLIVLAPVVFALVSTLGTLKLLGRPVDIPGIMLWIVIMGMGIDYGIYYTCSYQRYLDERHPSMSLIRQAMFLAGATTLIGFGVLALAKHAVLRSIGLTSLLGIAYSLIGAFLIVPPLVKRALVPVELPPERLEAGSPRHTERTLLRYRTIETTPRLFARWKLRLDPMFPRLAAFVKDPRRILDIGCGYGVPSAWLLELFPAATVTCIDPDGERVRVAGRALGRGGRPGSAGRPRSGGFPTAPIRRSSSTSSTCSTTTSLRETLAILHDKLLPGGRLVIRATIPAGGGRPWMRWIEERRLKRHRLSPRYRSREALETMIRAAGFEIVTVEGPAVPRSEEFWFIADRRATGRDVAMKDFFYRCLMFLARRFGSWIFLLIAWHVALGYFLFFPRRVAVSVRFYRRLFPERPRRYALWCAWQQYHHFVHVFLDRFLLLEGAELETTYEGWEHIVAAAQSGRGGIILMSHVGSWEIAAHLLRHYGQGDPRMKLMLYLGAKHREQIERRQKKSIEKSGIRIVSVPEEGGSAMDILEGLKFLREGGLVSLTGDRLWGQMQTGRHRPVRRLPGPDSRDPLHPGDDVRGAAPDLFRVPHGKGEVSSRHAAAPHRRGGLTRRAAQGRRGGRPGLCRPPCRDGPRPPLRVVPLRALPLPEVCLRPLPARQRTWEAV